MSKKVTISAKEFLDNNFSTSQQEKLRQEALDIALKQRSLKQLQEGKGPTQTQVAEILNAQPENVSQCEHIKDMKISNL